MINNFEITGDGFIGSTSVPISIRKEPVSMIEVRTDMKPWARISADGKLELLDMDICAEGPSNHYTCLGIGIWNAAIEKAALEADSGLHLDGKTLGDVIRALKK